MTAPASGRKWEMNVAKRERVPLIVGLSGPSGGGKTLSALRLAKGIQEVLGGDIGYVDTEAKRALHYADYFSFHHTPFDPPFGSLDYLDVVEHLYRKGIRNFIIDSFSHEHEGPGGLLDFKEKELERLTKGQDSASDRYNMLAWQKPKAARRKLINRLLQIQANFIWCFRAKQGVKPIKSDGKTKVVEMGFTPIAGDEFVFECTVAALLPPHSGGVPQWESELPGELMMMKLPRQFREIFREKRPLDEEHGRLLAEWARGGEGSTQGAGGEQRAREGSPPAREERPPDPASGPRRDDQDEPCWEPMRGGLKCKLARGHEGNHVPGPPR